MRKSKWPGALQSDRAGNIIPSGTISHSDDSQRLQHPYVEIWRVDRWLRVERVEVRR